MKKYLVVISLGLLLSIAGAISVKAGYATGPDKKQYMTAKAGFLWIEGTLSNYHPTDHYYKRVYAEAGNSGTFSDWALPSTHSITRRDSRNIFEPDNAMTKPCWKYSSSGNQICAW